MIHHRKYYVAIKLHGEELEWALGTTVIHTPLECSCSWQTEFLCPSAGSAHKSSFLLMHTWETAIVIQVLESLPPCSWHLRAAWPIASCCCIWGNEPGDKRPPFLCLSDETNKKTILEVMMKSYIYRHEKDMTTSYYPEAIPTKLWNRDWNCGTLG